VRSMALPKEPKERTAGICEATERGKNDSSRLCFVRERAISSRDFAWINAGVALNSSLRNSKMNTYRTVTLFPTSKRQ
jgi:hypothetical protein